MGSMHTGLEGHSIPSIVEKYVLGPSEETQNVDHSLERMGAYFRERALGGVGLMVTGGISPNREGWVGPFAAKLTTENEMLAHRVVTQAVHSVTVPIYNHNNTTTTTEKAIQPKICLQLLHTGRYAYHPFAVSASTTKSPISPFRAKGLSYAGVQSTIQDFTRSAVLAKRAGYDGVEIMGSEGYLISQFLSPNTNHRTDDYGGDNFANRARFPLEIVRSVRQATGPDFLIVFRISLLDLVDGGMTFEESLELAVELEHAGVSILNTGIGWHEARVPTIATCVPRGAFGFSTKALKDANVVNIPLVSTNRINTPEIAEDLLANGTSDLVSMARPLLADPNFVQKAMNEQAESINTCIACNQACLDHAFVGKTASCLVNPRACHETELPEPRLLPESERLKIGVVGAGPAGCAFAMTAAEMGHSVTLYDRSDTIGGQFNMAKRIPGKEEFHETLRYFHHQLRNNERVTIRLNTAVSHQDMIKDSAENNAIDKWVISTGVTPRDPKIPGMEGNPKVLSYLDVLKHNKPVGDRVAIIGAGGIGFDVAEFLLHDDDEVDRTFQDVSMEEFWEEWGIDTKQQTRGGLSSKSSSSSKPKREIHLLQRKKGKLGAGLGRTTGWIHRATLAKGRVNMINGVSYDKIDEEGKLHYTREDEQHVLEVDTIVSCAGQVEHKELEEEAQGTDLADYVYTIGGAFKAGELDAKRAIDMGTRLALRIHEAEVVPGKHIFQSPVGAEEKMFHLMRRFM